MANALQDLSRGATLSNYTPSLRENITNKLAQLWYGDSREGTQKANRLMELLDFTPVGVATGMYDAGRDLGQGNYGMGLAGIGLAAMPVPGSVKKEAQQGIRAFHGSPHDFNAFDMSKIGTGEGAQAYGHGLYFAEKEGTAKAYRDVLAGQMSNPARNQRLSELASTMEKYAIPGKHRQYSNPRGTAAAEEYDRILQMRADDKGHMYEVNINAHPDQFLDWDKPLSEQPPHIQQIARDIDLSPLPTRLRGKIQKWRDGTANPLEMPNGNDLHSALTDFGTNTKNNAELTSNLKQQGIPGIKYLDQGSRAAGDGSRNYVVFDDKLISIVKKYGIAGGLMLGAITQQQADQLKQQGY